MSYRPGQMGIAEGTALAFILTFPRVFLTTPVSHLDNSATLGWLSPLLAGITALGIFLLLHQATSGFSGDIINISQQLLGKPASWLIVFYGIFLFMSNVVLLLRQFAENTLLTALPSVEFAIVTLLYAAIAAISAYLGIEVIARASYLILPLIIVAILLVLLLLYPYYQFYNLLPWQGNGISKTISAGFGSAGLEFALFGLLVLRPAFQNNRTVRTSAVYGLGASTVIVSISILVFIMVFGVAVGREKVLPFFEMSRLVYLSRYLQRIEALFIIIWVVAGILGISANLYLTAYLFSRLFKLPSLRPIIPLLAITAVELAMIPSDVASVIELDRYMVTTYYRWGIYIIPAILITTAWFKKKKKVDACR